MLWSLQKPPSNFCRKKDGTIVTTYINNRLFGILDNTGYDASSIFLDGRINIQGYFLENHDVSHHLVANLDPLYSLYAPPRILIQLDDKYTVKLPLVLKLEFYSDLVPMHSFGCCGNTLLMCSHLVPQRLVYDDEPFYLLHNMHVEWDTCEDHHTEWNSDDE